MYLRLWHHLTCVFLTPARASSMKCWRRSRSVEWNGFPSRRAQVVFGHEFDVLFIYLFMSDWCLVCFQKIVSSFIHFPINRCYLKEGCENDVASSCIVSQHLAATQQHPETIEDPMMKQWEHGIYFKKSGQLMTAGFTAFHSQNGMMWEIMRWNYNEIFQHIITSILL